MQKIKSERQADTRELKESDILMLMQTVRITAVDTTMPDDAPRYILHPEAYLLRNVWDPFIRVLAVLLFLEVPFAISFHPEASLGTLFLKAPFAIRYCAFPCYLHLMSAHLHGIQSKREPSRAVLLIPGLCRRSLLVHN